MVHCSFLYGVGVEGPILKRTKLRSAARWTVLGSRALFAFCICSIRVCRTVFSEYGHWSAGGGVTFWNCNDEDTTRRFGMFGSS
jgi:hypothetical protein